MADENVVNIFAKEQRIDPLDDLDAAGREVDTMLIEIVSNLQRKEEDIDQDQLTTSLQKHRALILKFATLAYLKKPTSAMMLTSLIALIGSLEKSVRDDRKERAKKEEGETNQISFNQIIESLNAISQGAVVTPTFNLTSFILDPTKSLLDVENEFRPIRPEELQQGNALVDIDGNPI